MLARLPARQAAPRHRQGPPRQGASIGESVAPRTATERNPTPAQPSLEPLFALLRGDLERVNRLIVERMHSPVALIPQLAGHIVSAGGKRLRPMLTLASARLCGYRGEDHLALAAAVEFIPTATLPPADVGDASHL